MIGLNAGLEVARRSLSAYQLAMSIYGNNIANVNTPGFSRRRPVLGENGAAELAPGRVGLGVTTRMISRMRDVFLDKAYRDATASFARYEAMEQALSEVEMVFGEPSDVGLGTALQEFWNAWQELANQPESITPRAMVVSKATNLTECLRRMWSSLTEIRQNLDIEIEARVGEMNSLASRIAALNNEIVRAECNGTEASDLRDSRDQLVDQLSEIVGIKTFESADGSLSVRIGGETLVEHGTAVRLELATRSDRSIAVSSIVIGRGSRVISPGSGKIAGLLEARDTTIPEFLDRLDEIARTLVERVNEVHRQGYGLDGESGRNFFNPDRVTASTIAVSEDIIDDLKKIAASTDGTPGNQANALRIARLRLERIFGSNEATSDDYYSSTVGELGVASSRASTQKESHGLMRKEVANRRESVKGVSLDEEMTNLIATQHAYQAAVKLVSLIDGLMEDLMQVL